MIKIALKFRSINAQVREICEKYWAITKYREYYRFKYELSDIVAVHDLGSEKDLIDLVKEHVKASSTCQLCLEDVLLKNRNDFDKYYNAYEFRAKFLCNGCQNSMKGIPDLSAFIRPMVSSSLIQKYFEGLKQYYPNVFPNISFVNLLDHEGQDKLYNEIILTNDQYKDSRIHFSELRFDFIICNKDCRPILVVDHFNGTQEEKNVDILKRSLLKSLKIPYLHIPTDQDRIFNSEFVSVLIGHCVQPSTEEQADDQRTIILGSRANTMKE